MTTVSDSPFRTPQQRLEEREAKRRAVLRTAVQMFNERGFHATSLEDVAARLGISKPTIYHYLGNKDQVLLECLSSGLEQLREAAEASHRQPGTGLERLRSFLRRFAEVNMSEWGRCVIRTGEENLAPESAERLKVLKREVDGKMRALISEGIADGSIADGDPMIIAFTLAGALNWPARWFNENGKDSAEKVAEQMVDLLTAGIAPRK